MSLLDEVYGSWPGYNSGVIYGGGVGGPDKGPGTTPGGSTFDPSSTTVPSAATRAPARGIAGEPGQGMAMGLSPAALLENPATWLVLTVGAAVMLARYAAIGRVL